MTSILICYAVINFYNNTSYLFGLCFFISQQFIFNDNTQEYEAKFVKLFCNFKGFFTLILINVYDKNIKILGTISVHSEKVIYSIKFILFKKYPSWPAGKDFCYQAWSFLIYFIFESKYIYIFTLLAKNNTRIKMISFLHFFFLESDPLSSSLYVLSNTWKFECVNDHMSLLISTLFG